MDFGYTPLQRKKFGTGENQKCVHVQKETEKKYI